MIAARLSSTFLQPALSRLDQLIAAAADRAAEVYGPTAARDAFRGLYLNAADFERMLSQIPGEPLLWCDSGPDSNLTAMTAELGLSAFDLDVLLIAAAPELDLKYERLFGFLQDDVTRKRPTVDLALQLLCPTAEMRLLRRAHFAPDAPLFAGRLLRLVADPSQVEPPLLAHYLKAEPQALAFLTGQPVPDPRLAAFCLLSTDVVSWDSTVLAAPEAEALNRLASTSRAEGQPLRLFFEGPRGGGQADAAAALAWALDCPLLSADLERAAECRADFETVLPALFAEARSRSALLYIEGLDAAPRSLLESLVEERNEPTVAAGPRCLAGWFPVSFHTMSAESCRRMWEQSAAAEDLFLTADVIDLLHSRLRLTPKQIRDTVRTARRNAIWHGTTEIDARDLLAAARIHTGHELDSLARKVRAHHGWDDIVLPADTQDQLREMCRRATLRSRVLEDWGFASKLSQGLGVTALFAGPSGSGKTMAVEIISSELQLDAYKIDLSGVVSKYIGETEKNLDRIFTAAESANAILFFDEADALFGKRSEVRDSHDRYANIEISYLLQKMEEYSGIAILATNLRQNLDDAFVRRLAFSVHFPFPDEAARTRIWKGIWPAGVPLAHDVDAAVLARQFPLSGGNIRNVALAAAFLASHDGEPVAMRHILHATRREYQKYGKHAQPGEVMTAVAEVAHA